MDNTNVREHLLTLYQQTLGRTIDAKTLSYWTNLITKGDKPIGAFEAMIIAEPDYNERLRQIFNAAFREVVGYDYEFPKNDFKAFLARDDASTKVPTFIDVINWIKGNSTDYVSKYEGIINVTYNIHTDSECNRDVIDFYMSKMRTVTDYTLNNLETDIRNGAHMVDQSEAKQVAVAKTWTELVAEEIDDPPLKSQVLELDVTKLIDLLIRDEEHGTQSNFKIPALNQGALQQYERVFGRPMYVKEYFKYVLETDKEYSSQDLQEIKDKQMKDFNILYGLYKNYNDTELTEWRFVNEHLYDVDDCQFFEMFVDGIVYSNEYKTAMVNVLNESNKQLYDTTLDDNDIEYVFKKVQELKIGLNDSKVIEVLKSLKTETDIFVEHISDTYKKTLERQPDVYEITKYMEMYRKQVPVTGLEVIDEQLSKMLINELEFHDIIKKHIVSVYSVRRGGDILRSKLFEVLNKVLQNLENVNMDMLDVMIESLI